MIDDIAISIEEYNQYVHRICATIFPFDIWYEHTTGTPIPNDWKLYIKTGNIDNATE